VELVIKQPQHPYSRLLISSIPAPDVSERWDDDNAPPTRTEASSRSRQGCLFADRCPAVMQMCSDVAPPLYRLDDQRATACYLYNDRPVLAREAMGQVLARGNGVSVPE
jgi:peptide/nickel transport system ATP-binding protein